MGLTSVYGNAFSQLKVNLTVHNATLQEVFEQLTETTDYRFVYSSDLLNKAQKITCDFQNESIESVLAECLEGTNLWYRIEGEDKVVIISPKFQRPYVPVKEITLTGKVVDKDGQPLPGVSVVLKGTTMGVATDVNGNFTLVIPDTEGARLVFSFVGMKTQELPIVAGKPMHVVMIADSEQMEEVIVTGYSTRKVSEMTGAVQQFRGADIVQSVTGGNVMNALKGHTTGLHITGSTGEPGQDGNLRKRKQYMDLIRNALAGSGHSFRSDRNSVSYVVTEYADKKGWILFLANWERKRTTTVSLALPGQEKARYAAECFSSAENVLREGVIASRNKWNAKDLSGFQIALKPAEVKLIRILREGARP